MRIIIYVYDIINIVFYRSEDAADMLISDEDYSRVQSSLSDMMYAICDHAHDRCVKVIVARSKVSMRKNKNFLINTYNNRMYFKR